MSKAHKKIIKEHRKKIGALRLCVDYDPNCDPEELRTALESLNKKFSEWSSFPENLRLKAEIHQLEKRLGRIAELIKTDFSQMIAESKEVREFKQKIFEEVDILALDQDEAIKFCRENS